MAQVDRVLQAQSCDEGARALVALAKDSSLRLEELSAFFQALPQLLQQLHAWLDSGPGSSATANLSRALHPNGTLVGLLRDPQHQAPQYSYPLNALPQSVRRHYPDVKPQSYVVAKTREEERKQQAERGANLTALEYFWTALVSYLGDDPPKRELWQRRTMSSAYDQLLWLHLRRQPQGSPDAAPPANPRCGPADSDTLLDLILEFWVFPKEPLQPPTRGSTSRACVALRLRALRTVGVHCLLALTKELVQAPKADAGGAVAWALGTPGERLPETVLEAVHAMVHLMLQLTQHEPVQQAGQGYGTMAWLTEYRNLVQLWLLLCQPWQARSRAAALDRNEGWPTKSFQPEPTSHVSAWGAYLETFHPLYSELFIGVLMHPVITSGALCDGNFDSNAHQFRECILGDLVDVLTFFTDPDLLQVLATRSRTAPHLHREGELREKAAVVAGPHGRPDARAAEAASGAWRVLLGCEYVVGARKLSALSRRVKGGVWAQVLPDAEERDAATVFMRQGLHGLRAGAAAVAARGSSLVERRAKPDVKPPLVDPGDPWRRPQGSFELAALLWLTWHFAARLAAEGQKPPTWPRHFADARNLYPILVVLMVLVFFMGLWPQSVIGGYVGYAYLLFTGYTTWLAWSG